MKALTPSELLEVWEYGLSAPLLEWALRVICAFHPGTSPQTHASMSIGQRDACLLRLREQTFGPGLRGLCDCPGCGEGMEMALDVADLLVDAPPEMEASQWLKFDAFDVRFRLPNSLDLSTVAGSCGDNLEESRLLLRQCLMEARCQEKRVGFDALPAIVLDAVAEKIAQADSQADIQLELICPACSHHWQAAFDIAAFFRQELNGWAKRLLHDVHTLAAAYGWSEGAILSLSPARRQAYLEMVNG
jgi:hypothetical protein